ncbi:MAG TPA: hypothetical protein VMU54_25210 [Planctomycetota bacterium]|nr:hypothetical protein [Planctomycetota bacterium]
MPSQEDQLLGALAVREKMCTPEQIDECIRTQKLSREPAPLGDILVYKGFLTEVQVKLLLSRQNKKLMECSACGLSFTVVTLSDGKSARCPKCKGPLKELPPVRSVRTDAEFATRRIRVQQPAPAGPTIELACKICDHAFRGMPDSDGRVRCPSCQSTFTFHRKT